MRRPTIPRRRRAVLAPAIATAVLLAPALVPVAAGQETGGDAPRLRIAIPAHDGSLTPYTFESGYAFMSLVYDTLTWRDAEGVAQPWLARSVRRGPNGLEVRVRLRQNIRWHDGRRLTADDVAFTYRYMSLRPHPRFTPQLEDIRGIEVTGPLNLTFHLRRPSLGFADQPLADVPILPRHLWSGLPPGRAAPPGTPVGTGPYRLTRREPETGYRFQANRAYFRGVPSVARIDVPIVESEDAILGDIRRGQVDVVPLTIAPGTRPRRVTGVTYSAEPSYTGTMLLFNVARDPFRRLAARRAVARSLDLDALAGNASGVAGGAVPADHGMVHPDSPWALAGTLHRVDERAARLAFSEEGIGGFRIAVANNDPVRRATARRVVDALTRLGAGARVLELSPRALDRALGRRGRRATFDAAVVGIPALVSYDPSFLRAVFGPPRTAPLNDGAYRSTTFEDDAERVAAATTQPERREAVKAELRFLARDLPAVPLLFGGGTFVYRQRAYDDWVSVRGTGVLDKRSFLQGARAPVAAQAPGAPVEDLLDPEDSGGFSLVPIIIGFLLLAGAGYVRWLRRR